MKRNVSITLVKCKWQYRFKKNAKKFYLSKSVKSLLELLPNIQRSPTDITITVYTLLAQLSAPLKLLFPLITNTQYH